MEKIPELVEYALLPRRRPIRWGAGTSAGCMLGFVAGGIVDVAIAIPVAFIQPSDRFLQVLVNIDFWIVLLTSIGGLVFGLCYAINQARQGKTL